ncbi:hypothetical protein BGZ94_001444 [Podila epigama]|nr:hypothetical protein BGZ94_001444 [Podila epigama]
MTSKPTYHVQQGHASQPQGTLLTSSRHEHDNTQEKSSKKKLRSKSLSQNQSNSLDGNVKSSKGNKKKGEKIHRQDQHLQPQSAPPPSTIESLYQQERQFQNMVDDRVTLEEWLHKRSSSLQLVWKRRWCVLRNDCLFYYRSNTDTKPLGILHLADYPILTTGTDIFRKSKHTFRLSASASIPHEQRHHLFHAETAEALDIWIEALQPHIEHARSAQALSNLGPLDIGLSGPQYSHRYISHRSSNQHGLGHQDNRNYGDSNQMGDQSIIDKVLDRLLLLDDQNEIDPTLSDMNDPSTLIIPVQEHPSPLATSTSFTRSHHQAICTDDDLDGWQSMPKNKTNSGHGIKSNLESVQEHVLVKNTIRSPIGIHAPATSTTSSPSTGQSMRPRLSYGDVSSTSSSYTDVSHSNYSSFSDASYSGMKHRVAAHSNEIKGTSRGITSPLVKASTYSPASSYHSQSPISRPTSHSRQQGSSSTQDSAVEFIHAASSSTLSHDSGQVSRRERAESNASSTSISSAVSSGGVTLYVEPVDQVSLSNASTPSDLTLRGFGHTKDRQQKSDPVPHVNNSPIVKKLSFPALSTTSIVGTPKSMTLSTNDPKDTKDGKDGKKTRKLWPGFGATLSSAPIPLPGSTGSSDQHDENSSVKVGSMGMTRTLDTNSPWFKDLVVISSPPKPTSTHSASSVSLTDSDRGRSKRKGSVRGFVSKSMVSLTKSSIATPPPEHALPSPPLPSPFHQSQQQHRRISTRVNRARSPPISNLEGLQQPQHFSYQGLSTSGSRQSSETLYSQPTVEDLLTGFMATEHQQSRQSQASLTPGARLCVSGPIPIVTMPSSTAVTINEPPISPRLLPWKRFGADKSTSHGHVYYSNKQKTLCADPEVMLPTFSSLHDKNQKSVESTSPRSLLPCHVQNLKRGSMIEGQGVQYQSTDEEVGVSRHIIAPEELAQAIKEEEKAEEEERMGRERLAHRRTMSEGSILCSSNSNSSSDSHINGELADVTKIEEERPNIPLETTAKTSTTATEICGKDDSVMETSLPPVSSLRQNPTIARQASASFEADLISKVIDPPQEHQDGNNEAIESLLPTVVSTTVEASPLSENKIPSELPGNITQTLKPGRMSLESRRLSVSITAVSAIAHTHLVQQNQHQHQHQHQQQQQQEVQPKNDFKSSLSLTPTDIPSGPPALPRRSPHRSNPTSPT